MDPEEAQNGAQINPFGAPGGVQKQHQNRDRFLDDFEPIWGRFGGRFAAQMGARTKPKTTKKTTKKKDT